MTAIPLGGGREFDRIREIATALGSAAGPIGDDTAPVPAGEGMLVVSTDSSVEHHHFRREWLSLQEIGWRATASALSDLAASAARPAGLLVALTVPPDATPEDTVMMMRGAGDCARDAHTQILGGDLTAGDCWALTVTVLGHALHPMSRRGARPGDGLWVSGTLGGARAALQEWVRGGEPDEAARIAFAHPLPRITAGRWLAAHGAHAMLDLSDGLGGDALHLAAASAVQLRIDLDLLPLHPSVVRAAALAEEPPAVFAGAGGEDYELLVALPGGWDGAARCEAATGVPVTRIGSVAEGNGVSTIFGGRPVALATFRHDL